MNDFKASTPFDDKTRIRFQNEVDSLKKGLAKDADKFPPDSAAYRRELTRRIFEEHTKKEKFYGDCEIECDDHEAIKFRRGICTETSAVVYFKCKYAGLNPSFFYLHDIEPSLQWLDLLPKLGEAADHVFIGVPLSDNAGGAASKEFLYVDPVREMFDVEYKHAKEIPERVFASLSTRNKASDIALHRRFRDAEETLKNAIILTPEDIQPYLVEGSGSFS